MNSAELKKPLKDRDTNSPTVPLTTKDQMNSEAFVLTTSAPAHKTASVQETQEQNDPDDHESPSYSFITYLLINFPRTYSLSIF